MELEKDTIKRQYKWHIFLILIMSASLIALALFTDVFLRLKASTILWPLRVVVVLVFLAAVISIVLKLFKTLDVLKGNGEMLEKIVEDMENNRVILEKINQNTRLSETAKAITFRDADKQSLREAVLDKLQQQDFEGTEEIINCPHCYRFLYFNGEPGDGPTPEVTSDSTAESAKNDSSAPADEA